MSVPTEPQQDRNVEGSVELLSIEELNRMADYAFQHGSLPGVDAVKLFNALASAEEELCQLRNSRPSQPPQVSPHLTIATECPRCGCNYCVHHDLQPPQNVKVGDAVKQTEIDYANRREEDIRQSDAAKGVVEEIEVLRKEHSRIAQENNVHPFTGTRHRMNMVNLLFSDRLRLALSARGDKFKVVANGPPCPTCGFSITRRDREPFVVEDDPLESIESNQQVRDADARGGDQELQRLRDELNEIFEMCQKAGMAATAAPDSMTRCSAVRIVHRLIEHRRIDAERLKVAEALLRRYREESYYADNPELCNAIDAFFAPAQTPGDERQG